MAIGCLAALRESGLRVPEDVSLVGFDDIPIARYLTPALTTVRVPIAELGRRAISRVLACIAGGGAAGAGHEVIAPVLAIRASAGPAAGVRHRKSTQRRKSP
jgi:LacI family transcriptional regulator